MSAAGSSQRVRKSSPCAAASKQGPMRATLPVASLLRQAPRAPARAHSPATRRSTSSSPTTPTAPPSLSVSPAGWRGASRTSPDAALGLGSGQRSPGSLSYKGYFAKSKTLSARGTDGLAVAAAVAAAAAHSIRRTASLDAIYLKGQWPRDSHYLHTSLLVDKATQTDEGGVPEPRKTHTRPNSAVNEQQTIPDEKLEKYFRHRLQRTNKESTSSRERTAAFGLITPAGGPALPADHSVLLPSIASQTFAYNQSCLSSKAIPIKPMRPPMRSSIEGLNQEIEGLVLKSGANSHDELLIEDKYARLRDQITPEGHRAPLADLFRSNRSVNSVNTQTPATDLPSSCYSSGPPSRNSESPLIPGSMDVSRPSSDLIQGGSRGSTPDHDREGRLGTSPHINRFLAREPPDGCEKVNTKFIEDVRRPMVDLSKLDYCSKPSVAFQLKPSLGSAFLPLQQSVKQTVVTNSTSVNTSPTTPPPNP